MAYSALYKGRKRREDRGRDAKPELLWDTHHFSEPSAIPQSNNGHKYHEMSETGFSPPAEIHWDEK